MTDSSSRSPATGSVLGFDAELAAWLRAGDSEEIDDVRAQRLLRELDRRIDAAGPMQTISPAVADAAPPRRMLVVRALAALLPLAIGIGLGFAGYSPLVSTTAEEEDVVVVDDPSVAPFLFAANTSSSAGALP